MELSIRRVTKAGENECLVIVSDGRTKWKDHALTDREIKYVEAQQKKEKSIVALNQYNRWVFIYLKEKEKEEYKSLENFRKAGDKILSFINNGKFASVVVADGGVSPKELLCFVEGMALGNYQFTKYRKKNYREKNTLAEIGVLSKNASDADLQTLNILVEATCMARDLVNTPLLDLSAVQLSQAFEAMGKRSGFSVEVFNKKKIESLKMGGLLAVNAGSPDPPTFTIMEYKPRNARNKKPVVLVGKGVVYDTGGLSLKPTLNSMDHMKSDMAGAAAVACTIYAAAKAKLPVHIVSIVPATDNRPGGNAITPGDVITMHNGVTVEILNTDAEGRLILGDALSFAKKYDPMLVIDLATLTGAAIAAIAQYGIVSMGTAGDDTKEKLEEAGYDVYERTAELPFWDEYDELIRSDIADIKNVGGSYAGAITAGKFLEHFVSYPWIHLDIAGPSYLHKSDSYRGKAGTGVGVRLLFEFLRKI